MSASREIAAAPDVVFELIADPAQQPRWDGNGNLTEAAPGSACGRWAMCTTAENLAASIERLATLGEGA